MYYNFVLCVSLQFLNNNYKYLKLNIVKDVTVLKDNNLLILIIIPFSLTIKTTTRLKH